MTFVSNRPLFCLLATDIWSIWCIFAELSTVKPLTWEECRPSVWPHEWSVGNSIFPSHCQGLFAMRVSYAVSHCFTSLTFHFVIESLTVHCRYEMRKIGDTKAAGGRRSQSLSPRSSLMHSIKNVGIWVQGSAYHGEGNF